MMLLQLGSACGPGGSTDPNGNGDGGNTNGGTGRTVDDLPNLSDDDTLGTGEGPDTVISGLILVGFDPGTSDELLLQLAASTATAINGQIVDIIPDIRVVTIAVESGSEAQAISTAGPLQNVDYAELDFAGRVAAIDDLLPLANSAKFSQYQLFLTNAISARGLVTSGSGGVTVAVLDTGCALNHPEFVGSAIFSGANTISGGSDVGDDFPGGHGTGVVSLLSASVDAGEIAGLLPGFTVTVHKVCDASGFCPVDAVVLGIIGALNGSSDLDVTTTEIPTADVINISASFAFKSESLSRAIAEAQSRGVIVVAAAGNNGRSAEATDSRYPASYSSVISVGASDIEDQAAPFSNRSAELDVVAPGVDLLVASSNGAYQYVDGTSYAAAQVTAAAAWLIEREGPMTPAAVRERIAIRGDLLPNASGFGDVSLRRLNLLATLQDQNQAPEPFIIPDDDLIDMTNVGRDTLVSAQAGQPASGPVAEAFTDELIHWYGYFLDPDLTFDVIDGNDRITLSPQSVTTSTIDLFLEFVRGIELGTLEASFGVMQQAILEMPDLGGQRRAVEIVATAASIESQPRTIIYNPLQRGYNIVSYKNFDSANLRLLEEEGDDFDPQQADIQLLGNSAQPQINWSGATFTSSVQLGSSLDPSYFVTAQAGQSQISSPLRLGDCVGSDTPEQICGVDVGLPENVSARILIRSTESAGDRFAILEVIYVP